MEGKHLLSIAKGSYLCCSAHRPACGSSEPCKVNHREAWSRQKPSLFVLVRVPVGVGMYGGVGEGTGNLKKASCVTEYLPRVDPHVEFK